MTQRSLILITVDCLRADHVGFQGYSRPVTPFLDSLSCESATLSNAIVAGAPTYFSFPGILASRHPLALGREVLGVAPGEATIASALQKAGYTTAAFVAGNPYLSSHYGYDQGFSSFRNFLDAPLPGDSTVISQPNNGLSTLNRRLDALSHRSRLAGAVYDELYFRYCQWRSRSDNLSMDQLRRYPAANVLVDEACSWLKDNGREPFFLWLHFMDPHHPYYPPDQALASLGIFGMSSRRARFLNSFWNRGDLGPERLHRYRPELLSLYDAGVHWVDTQISRLVEALQQLDCSNNTVLAVTADHGEEFLEHGRRYHSPTSLPEELIHVPLFIHAPNLPPATLRGPFSLIHLAPTLLEAVSVDAPVSFQGRSHWKEITAGKLDAQPAVTECAEGSDNHLRVEDRLRPRLLAVRDDRYKLLIRFSDRTDRLCDLKTDPEERSPVPEGVQTDQRIKLLKVARDHLRKSRADRNVELALKARVRDIRQTIESAAPTQSSIEV